MVGLFHEDFSTATLTPEQPKKINAVRRKPVGDVTTGYHHRSSNHSSQGSCELSQLSESPQQNQIQSMDFVDIQDYATNLPPVDEYNACYNNDAAEIAFAQNLAHDHNGQQLQLLESPFADSLETDLETQLQPAAIMNERLPEEPVDAKPPLNLMDPAGKDLAPALALAAIAEPIHRSKREPSHMSIASTSSNASYLLNYSISSEADYNPNPYAADPTGNTSRQQSPTGAQSPIRRRPVGAGDSRSDGASPSSTESPLVSVLEHADLIEPSRVRRVPVPGLEAPKLPTPPQQPFECSF